jgi:GNAT superfamily N-acetyltransferase
MHVERVDVATAEVLGALQRLIPQLTAKSPPSSMADVGRLLRHESTTLVVAREPDAAGSIVGAGCLVMYRVPSGTRAIIEDVVVDEAVRGRGIGRAVVQYLLDLARLQGARGVALTSNPHREAANRLYLRMGFLPRQTNAFYYDLSWE